MKKNPASRTLYARSAHTVHQTNFFATRHIVCQITGKNGAEFKNYVENQLCAHRTPAARQHLGKYYFLDTRHIV